MTNPDVIKGLVVFVKTDKGVYEVCLSELVKKEIFKLIDSYGTITLVGIDVSEVIEFKK